MTTTTVRETADFALIEDRLGGIGRWHRRADDTLTYWETGMDWAITKAQFGDPNVTSDVAFNREGLLQEFHA